MYRKNLIQYYNLLMQAKSPTHQHAQKTKPIFQFLPGPVKIKDGLFMGDQIAAKDIEFIISNKVTHIINTVSKKIPNLWQRFGIHYLSVNWTEKEQNIFDKTNNSVNTIFHFIEEAMEQGQSCLIHSVNGKTRACSVLVAYLIKKYCWSLDKCLEFVASKKQNLQIRNGYLVQLQELDKRMAQIYNLTSDWEKTKTEEELILKNTFANSQPALMQPQTNTKKSTKKHVSWVEKPTVHKSNVNKSIPHKESFKKSTKTALKSILKGDQEDEETIKNIEEESFDQFKEGKPFKKDEILNSINNIKGNIVHVTVNNFITTDKSDKKKEEKTPLNSRPYSSDQKQREKEKDKKIINQKKLLVYDTNPVPMKSPYDHKLANRIGSNTKLPKKKQQKQTKPAYQERPQSAKHRNGGFNSSQMKNELVVMNSASSGMSGKKRYPSNPRQEFFKRK